MEAETVYDHLAFTFAAMAVTQCSLETLANRARVSVSNISELALRNAMMRRDVLVQDGMVSRYEGHQFKDTVQQSFRKFVERAAEIIEFADAPIPAVDLIGMTGLVEAAIPLSAMKHHLRKAGFHFIPGLGYWHKRHFVDDKGTLYGSRNGSKQADAMFKAFTEYGWPMTALDIEAATKGEVTSQYVTLAVKRPWPDIISVGYGLYVPAGAARRIGFPMSKNIAQSFLELDPKELIDSKDNTRMYRMCDLLQKMGYGLTRQSSQMRDRKQRRAAYFQLNDTGRRKLTALVSSKKPNDEF